MAQQEIDITKSATQLQNDINNNFDELYERGGGDVSTSPQGNGSDGGDYMVCVYDVNTTGDTLLGEYLSSYFDSMEIDGGEAETIPSQNKQVKYQFETKGLHVIRYKLKANRTDLQTSGTLFGTSRIMYAIFPHAIQTMTTSGSILGNCNRLRRVVFDENVTDISKCLSFSGAAPMFDIVMLGSTPPSVSSLAVHELTRIHVPAGSAEAYKEHADWSDYADQITEEPVAEAVDLFTASAKIDNNPLQGKKFAFLGDSFTADSMSICTWCKVLCRNLNAVYYANEAGGSQGWLAGQGAVKQARDLVSNIASEPDYILAFMGVNDKLTTVGSISYAKGMDDTYDETASGSRTFAMAVQATVEILQSNFPNAVIKIGWTPSGSQYEQASGQHLDISPFLDILKEVALLYGVEYVETHFCGISLLASAADLFADGTAISGNSHPSEKGHKKIGDAMTRIMLCHL